MRRATGTDALSINLFGPLERVPASLQKCRLAREVKYPAAAPATCFNHPRLDNPLLVFK